MCQGENIVTVCANCYDAATTKSREVAFWRVTDVRSQWITEYVPPVKENKHVSFQTPNHFGTTKATNK
jgi:hypothetical protein